MGGNSEESGSVAPYLHVDCSQSWAAVESGGHFFLPRGAWPIIMRAWEAGFAWSRRNAAACVLVAEFARIQCYVAGLNSCEFSYGRVVLPSFP